VFFVQWHSNGVPDAFKQLGSSELGLSFKEAASRLKRFGPNEISLGKKVSVLKIFLSQFKGFLIMVLLFAGAISFIVSFFPGHEDSLINAILIFAIVVANGVFGFFQEFKAEESLAALKKMEPSKAIVLRNGQKHVVNAALLVPGDVIFLEAGEKVPADARLFQERNLHIDESLLTGESVPVSKHLVILKEETALAERINMVFKNSVVSSGTGLAVVTETGLATEVGKIAEKLNVAQPKSTPFQIELNRLGKKIGLIVLAIVAFVALNQFLFLDTSGTLFSRLLVVFLTAVSLAVAAIPEGLPAVVTWSLGLGTRRMAKKNALVRKLAAVEGLGEIDVICTDKTATLTENRMTVTTLFCNGKTVSVTGTGYDLAGVFSSNGSAIKTPEIELLLQAGVLCNNAGISFDEENRLSFVGDPTEIALLVSARKAGLDENRLNQLFPRIDEIPFSSESKRMATVHKTDDEAIVFMKGAPEIVLQHCTKLFSNGKEIALDEKARKEILEKNSEFAGNALRVLGFAYKKIKNNPPQKGLEDSLVFLGLQAMIDPPRKEVRQSIEECRQAGIRVVMVTGDNAVTAKAIAMQLGLGATALEGGQIENFSEQQLCKAVEETDIFARVSPQAKLRILKALQANNHVVAMTGDGVNDAPALHSADIGVAMGQRGTDVAREASDMILLDDNFSTIKEAVKEGRTIFGNIRKFVNYLLTCNFAEVMVVFFISFAGLAALAPTQILWINLLTDGPPALALGIDPSSDGIMRQKPKKKTEGVISKRVLCMIAGVGAVKTAILIGLFYAGMRYGGLAIAQTMLFTGFVLFEMAMIVVVRNQEKLGRFKNKWLFSAVALSLALQATLLFTPLGALFGVVPMVQPIYWAILLSSTLLFFLAATATTKFIAKIVPAG